jgi:methionyl-tRNA synthetase
MRRFISAGWPYLYDVPRLHNCVPMLLGDVAARFFRLIGDEVFFLCGADEHGARVEFVAEGVGLAPAALVDGKVKATLPLLEGLHLSFDRFGRTTDPDHERFVRDLLADIDRRGGLEERMLQIAHCAGCDRFLPDRFVVGACPHCGEKAWGSECRNKLGCGRPLSPGELRDPRCAVCGEAAAQRASTHRVFQLGRFAPDAMHGLTSTDRLAEPLRDAVSQIVAENQELPLTRDTAWGIAPPWDASRTVWDWVDALLAKVSFAERQGSYFSTPGAHKIFFLGADAVAFYGALLPSLLLASGRTWDLDGWWVVPNDMMLYEGSVCAKSTGTGIWLAEALAALPGDYWRFWIYHAYAHRAPGEREVDFRWERVAATLNDHLIGPLGRAVLDPGPGGADEATRVAEVRELLSRLRIGAAFRALVDLIAARPSATTLSEAIPLLGCFLPKTASFAASCLDAGEPLFPDGPVDARATQRRYTRAVEAGRAARTLEEEVTQARADDLCACPTRLSEG